VKREVVATSIRQAMTKRGVIYAIEESETTVPQKTKIGFSSNKKDK